MSRRDEPVPIGEAVAAIGRDLGLPEPSALRAVLAAWPEVVGDALASHARVRSLRDGVLTVAVDAPAYATQLRYVGDDLTRRLGERVGQGVVVDVRVVVEQRP